MPTLGRPWGTLNYVDEGSGPLVILLHPLAASGELWRRLIDELSGTHRVIAPDARGHGASVWNGENFTVPDLAEDVAALIDHLEVGPAHLVALSMGGCTAVATAVRYPGLVHRLVLADTTADYGPGKEDAWEERAARALAVPRDKQLTFQVDRWFSSGFLVSDPTEVKRIADIFVATDSRAHAAACRALGSYSDVDRLGEIRAATLVLVGEDDYATPPSMAHALHAGIVDSEYLIFFNTRHMSLVESATARSLVVRHLTRVDQRGKARHDDPHPRHSPATSTADVQPIDPRRDA